MYSQFPLLSQYVEIYTDRYDCRLKIKTIV